MTTTVRPTDRGGDGPVPRPELPAAARRRHPRGARHPARGVAAVLRRRRRPDRALHLPRVARAGEGAAVVAGVAVRLPRGAHPPRRRPHASTTSPAARTSIMRSAPDTIKAFPNACLHRGRQLKQYDGNCSEIRCPFHGFAWHLDGSLQDVPAAVGPPARHGRDASTCPRSRSARGTASCSSTPTPTPSRSRTSSRSWPPTSTAGTCATATCRRTCRRSSGPTGRSPRRRSARRSTSTPPTRRSSRTSATPTARSTCGRTAAG